MMMTRNQVNVYLAIILETVAEVPDGAPEGPMYAVLCDHLELTDFEVLASLATTLGLVTRKGHVMKITRKGLETVEKIRAARSEVSS
jgi:hypothetical protein